MEWRKDVLTLKDIEALGTVGSLFGFQNPRIRITLGAKLEVVRAILRSRGCPILAPFARVGIFFPSRQCIGHICVFKFTMRRSLDK